MTGHLSCNALPFCCFLFVAKRVANTECCSPWSTHNNNHGPDLEVIGVMMISRVFVCARRSRRAKESRVVASSSPSIRARFLSHAVGTSTFKTGSTLIRYTIPLDFRDARALHTLVLVDIYRYAKLAVMNGASESLLHGAYSSPHTGRRQAFTAVQTCEPLAPFSLFSLPPPLSLSPAISGRQFLAACHDLAQSGPACTTVAVCNTESVDRWRPCLLPGKAQLKRAPLAAAQRR